MYIVLIDYQTFTIDSGLSVKSAIKFDPMMG